VLLPDFIQQANSGVIKKAPEAGAFYETDGALI